MDELAEVTENDRQMAAIAYAAGGFSPLIALVIGLTASSDFVKQHAMKAALAHFVIAMVVTVIVMLTCGLGAPLILAAWGWGFWEAMQVMKTHEA
jgi:uncharacterized membrane protein